MQSSGIRIDQPSRAVETRPPVAIVKGFDSHSAAARRRVQETTVSYIDCHVRVSARQRVEEHQITRFELRARNRLADFPYFFGAPRKLAPRHVVVYEPNEPAAIEPGSRRGTAVSIRNIDQRKRTNDDVGFRTDGDVLDFRCIGAGEKKYRDSAKRSYANVHSVLIGSAAATSSQPALPPFLPAVARRSMYSRPTNQVATGMVADRGVPIARARHE